MAKVQIKSERITPFGGIFHVRERFSRYVGPVIGQSTGSPMYVIRLPVRRDCRIAGKCLLLWRWLRGGRYEPPDAPLKSHCGVRGDGVPNQTIRSFQLSWLTCPSTLLPWRVLLEITCGWEVLHFHHTNQLLHGVYLAYKHMLGVGRWSLCQDHTTWRRSTSRSW